MVKENVSVMQLRGCAYILTLSLARMDHATRKTVNTLMVMLCQLKKRVMTRILMKMDVRTK
jgi:hypothetical protein